jgi:DNA primase
VKFDVVEYCRDNIDNVKLNATKQLVGDCPWCEKSGHFYVDSETGNYICFACDQRGNRLVGVVAQIEGISDGEARRYIMKHNVEFRRKETPQTLLSKISSLEEKTEIHPTVCDLPPEFVPVYQDGRWSMPVYLKQRGIKRDTAREWGLGWARRGRYGGRVIIPVMCPAGRSFTARDATGAQSPRYLNPKGIDHGRLLIGWNHHPIGGDVVLVEGPFDAIKLWQHGFPAMALMGKVLHIEQFVMLIAKPTDVSIIIMLDPEEIEAPYKVAEQLVCRFRDVSIAKLPLGMDPGDSTREEAFKAIEDAVPYNGNKMSKTLAMIGNSRKRLNNFYA